MNRVYFGDWTCKGDMDLALRGMRERYDHADDKYLDAPYPLGDKPPATVVFAASPSTRQSKRPVIVMVRDGYFYVQTRPDRWSPKWMVDSLSRLSFIFTCRETAAAFAHLKDNALSIAGRYYRYVDTRCVGCGCHMGGLYECTDCSQIGRQAFRRDNPQEAARMARAAEEGRKL